LCAGYHPGLHPPPEYVQLPAESVAAIRTLLGLPSLEGFQPDPYATTCDACGGKGRTLTGSSIESHAHVQCLKCHGKGWVPVGDERRGEAVAIVGPVGAIAAPVDAETGDPVPQSSEAVDAWGTPLGDPMYGVAPQYRAARSGY
jgi:hypothetical protein